MIGCLIGGLTRGGIRRLIGGLTRRGTGGLTRDLTRDLTGDLTRLLIGTWDNMWYASFLIAFTLII